MRAVPHLLRQLRTSPSLLSVSAMVLIGTLLVAVAPRLIDQVSDDDLRGAVAEARPQQRNINVRSETRLGGASNSIPFRWLGIEGDRIRDEMPEALGALISDQQFLFDTPSFRMSSFPEGVEGPFPTFFTFRYQEDLDRELTVVAGRLPEARDAVEMLRGRDCPDDVLAVEDFDEAELLDCEVEDVPVFEVAVTAETAEIMGVALDDHVLLDPNLDDRLWFTGPLRSRPPLIILAFSAIVELTDENDAYWHGDTALHRPRITENADFRLIFATGIMRPDQYRRLLGDDPRLPRMPAQPTLMDFFRLRLMLDRRGSNHLLQSG